MMVPQIRLTEKTTPEAELIQIWSKEKLIELDKNNALFHPHRIDFSVLLFVTSQTAKHEVDSKLINLNKGDILLFGKQSVHRFIQESEWEGIVITVSDNYWFNDLNTQSILYIESLFSHCTLVKQNHAYDQLFSLITNLATRVPIQEPVIKHLLISLLLLISEKVQIPQATVGNALYSAFLDMLNSKRELQNINQMAKALKVSMYQLRKACIACSGKPPKQLMNEHILVEAIRLLKYTELPIQHISELLGFDEPSYFSKFIKTKTTLTPAKIRQSKTKAEFYRQEKMSQNNT